MYMGLLIRCDLKEDNVTRWAGGRKDINCHMDGSKAAAVASLYVLLLLVSGYICLVRKEAKVKGGGFFPYRGPSNCSAVAWPRLTSPSSL